MLRGVKYFPVRLVPYTCFYKQPVYKQVALSSQIATQLSGRNTFSLSNNKNCRLKKSGVFSF